MNLDLTGKVALVTGSSRGLGRAIALQLAEAGADIVVNFAQTRAAADETAGRIAGLGCRVTEVQADLTEPDEIQAMIYWIGETFGRLDILVSNVVPTPSSSLLSATAAQFDAAMSGSVRPLLLLAQAARPLFAAAPGPRKVIAVAGRMPADATGGGLSDAGRAAVAHAVRHLASELMGDDVQVNAVQTPAAAHHGADRERLSVGVSQTVLFLASPLSDQLQGQTLVVGVPEAVPA